MIDDLQYTLESFLFLLLHHLLHLGLVALLLLYLSLCFVLIYL